MPQIKSNMKSMRQDAAKKAANSAIKSTAPLRKLSLLLLRKTRTKLSVLL